MSDDDILKEFRKRRERGSEAVLNRDSLSIKRFIALDERAYDDGAIPKKYKELMGLAASMVLRCDDCVLYHLDRCLELGASEEEFNEAFNIALIVGGSIVIPVLRLACETLEKKL